MKKISIADRIILLLAVLLASYQVVVGIDGLPSLAVTSFTVGFGVLLIAGLLIFILGFEIMENPYVAIISTLIPLSLSTGLVAEYFDRFSILYIAFGSFAILVVLLTRFAAPKRTATLTLVVVHGIAGLLIFTIPLWLVLRQVVSPGFVLVGIAGGLIGVYGLLLSFLRMERPLISQQVTMRIFPLVLLIVTASFVAGFAF